jgi:tyrosine-protein kinase Etk/Wzc
MLQAQLTDTNENLERYKQRLTNYSGEFELGLFLFVAKRSLIWVFLFLAIALGGIWLYLRYAQTIYESSAVIQINTENNARMLNVDMMGMDDQNNLAAAIEMIRSQEFMKRVLTKLPLQVSYYAEGTIKTNEHYKSSPYTVNFTIKDAAIHNVPITIEFNAQRNGGRVEYMMGGALSESNFKFNKWVELPHASILISGDNARLNQMLDADGGNNTYYFTLNNQEDVVTRYTPLMSVVLLNDAAKTLKLSFTDQNPLKAYDIASIAAQEFIEYDIEKRSESSKKSLAFINDQLASVTNQLHISEDSMNRFKEQHNIMDNDQLNLFNLNRFGSIEDQLTLVELETTVLSEIKNRLADKNVDVKSILSLISGTQSASSLTIPLNNLYGLISERDVALYSVTPNSEVIRALNFQIDTQKSIIIASVNSLLDQSLIRKKALQDKLTEYGGKIPAEDQKLVEFQGLKRLYAVNEKFYNILLERKTELAIAEAGFTAKHLILEKAHVPQTPISPNKKITIFTALSIAFLLSLIVIIVRYLLHDTINSLNEIMKQTQASISALGIIPKYKNIVPVSQLLIDKNPKSLIAEAFRSLRTNLQFISSTSGSKVMAITSTISGEGKTFVAINLAGIIAYSGKKVIILDLDMRKPKIHLGFNVTNDKGMSTLLIGKEQISDCIKKSNLENLHFITAGPIPPNPSELIISDRMKQIIEELKHTYDMIIIDNPPVGLVTDGIAMLKCADYPVYVFRTDYSKRNFIQIVDRLYNENDIKKLSIVLNGIDADRRGYGYNYGYGYGYGYGQGYYDDDKESNLNTGWRKFISRKKR